MGPTTIIGALMAVLVGIGIADYTFKELPSRRALTNEQEPVVNEPVTPASSSESSASSIASVPLMPSEGSSSSLRLVKKGVSRKAGPDVASVLSSLQLSFTQAQEQSALAMLHEHPNFTSGVILENGDRVAFMAWIDTPEVKTIFTNLKQSLQASFSGNVKDLIDETQRPDVGAPRDVLSFMDDAIGFERFVFVRIRTRLYEFHVKEGKEPRVLTLIDALGK
jgi:hypothetical protein